MSDQTKMDFMKSTTVDKRDVIVDFDDCSDVFNPDNRKKEAIWEDAFTKKQFIFKDSNHLQEQVVDFSTFDMVLGTIVFDRNDKVNTLTMLKAFWRSLWPYVRNLVKAYYEVQTAWYELIEDQDTVLKNYADQNLELKVYREYINSKVTVDIKEDFEKFLKTRQEEDAVKIKEIQDIELAKKAEALASVK